MQSERDRSRSGIAPGQTPSVAVVGLGAMGRAVAGNLLAAGLPTTVWNRSPGPVADLAARGAIAAQDIAQCLECDVVVSLLLNDGALRAVLLDSNVLAAAPTGTVHVCMSSITTTMARALGETHAAHGQHFVAAPVFGRPEAAAAATLEIAMAGADDQLDRVEPVLRVLGRTWRIGADPQLAYLAKTAGNFAIGCAVEAMAEAAALLASRGGDAAPFFAMMGETLFAAPVYRSYGAAIAAGSFPGVAVGPARASLGPARTRAEAQAGGIRMPMADVVHDKLCAADAEGLGGEDWSVALATLARRPLPDQGR